MQLNQLKRITKNKSDKRVGRGGLRGKTAGRGTKGQKARAGHRIRPDVREKLKKLPKMRGYNFKSIAKTVAVVNVATLEKFFSAGDAVNPKVLVERELVRARRGTTPLVKILGEGEVSKKLAVSGCAVSVSAKEKIEKAGGSVQI
jgi:large subunit ribosomal protein L15